VLIKSKIEQEPPDRAIDSKKGNSDTDWLRMGAVEDGRRVRAVVLVMLAVAVVVWMGGGVCCVCVWWWGGGGGPPSFCSCQTGHR
jgi:hypothetical protein